MRIRLSDLAPGVNYALQLRSNTGDAVSDWSRVFNIVTSSDTVAPLTPTGISATMDGTAFNLFWSRVVTSADGTPANDLDHYEVQVTSGGSGVNGVYLVNDTKFQFTLDMNRTLYGSPRANIIMAVRAVDKMGNASAYSATFSQTNPAPANPTGFAANAVPDAINFKWNAVADTDIMTYRLYSGTTAGTQSTLEWTGLATNTTLQSIQYAVDKWYRVVAVDVFGTESPSGPVVGPIRPNSPFTVDTTAPPAVTGLAATLTNSTDGKTATAAVSWTAVADTDNDLSEYIIGYKPSATTDWQYTKVDYTNTSTTITGLLPYTNYDFRIRSSDWSANLSAWSSVLTKTAAANAAPAVPAGLSVTPSRDSLRIAWTMNTEPDMANGAGTYDVQVSTASDFSSGLTYRTGANQIVVNALASATPFYVRVRAVDSGGAQSAYATSVTATTGAPISSFAYTTGLTPPTSPNTGDIWMDTSSGFEKQWSGSAWVLTGNVSMQYIAGRAEDFVTNGTGYMKNNYNFTTYFDFNGSDPAPGATGSFYEKSTAARSSVIDEIIPYNPTKKYRYSFAIRQTVAGATNRAYGLIMPLDKDNKPITPYNYAYITGTQTTLAAPLNPGDTTITLTSSANWYGSASKPASTSTYLRTIQFWDYVDSTGQQWAPYTYTQNINANAWADGGISGNVITLNTAWTGPAKPAGTAVSNGTSGGSYLYTPSLVNGVISETWTTYSDVYQGGITTNAVSYPAAGGLGWNDPMPPGTANLKVGFLLNYPASPTNPIVGRMAVGAISFSDASAAQVTADSAYATASGKNKIIRSTSAASGTSGYVAGDLWWQIDGSGNAIGQWKFSGTAWVAEQLTSSVITNLDVNKLTAGTGLITTLNIASGGVVQSAGYTSGGTSGFQLSTSGLVIKGTGNQIDVNSIITSSLTSTTITLGAAGKISVGVGGSISIDGSTGQLISNNYAANSTGYRLSNAGLEVNDGSVDAKVLKTGTAIIGDLTIGRSADALGTIKSFDYVSGSAGWKIGKGLFEINQGAVRAAALQIQSGSNLMPAEYASFEYTPAFYNSGKITSEGIIWNVTGSSNPMFGQYYLGTIWGTSTSNPTIRLTTSATTYNIPVDTTKTYILSAYVRNTGSVNTVVNLKVKYSNGTTATIATTTPPVSNSAWVRISGTFTPPSTALHVLIDSTTWTANGAFEADGFQLEEKVGGINTPSSWNMPGITTTDGGMIRTGSIASSSTLTVNGTTQPAWSINLSGNAQFGDALIRGKLLVGQSGADVDAGQSYIASGNYVAGTTGWKIDSSGNAEFSNGIFRGTITGSSIYGSTVATSSNVNANRVVLNSTTGLEVWQGQVINMIENPRMKGSTSTTSQPGYTPLNATFSVITNPDFGSGYLPEKLLKVVPTTPTATTARARYTVPALVLSPNTSYVLQFRMFFHTPTSNANSTNNKYGVGFKRDDVRIIEGTSGRVIAMPDSSGWGGTNVSADDYKYEMGWRAAAPVYTEPYVGDFSSGGYMPFTFVFTTPSDWNNQPVTIELPGNGYVRNDSNGTYALDSTARLAWSQIMLEQNTVGSDYFDGSMTGVATWNGTADASRSTKAGERRSVIPVQANDPFLLSDISNLTFETANPNNEYTIQAGDSLMMRGTGQHPVLEIWSDGGDILMGNNNSNINFYGSQLSGTNQLVLNTKDPVSGNEGSMTLTSNGIYSYNMRPMDSGDAGTAVSTTSTTFQIYTGGPSIVFNAPASGSITVFSNVMIKSSVAGSYSEANVFLKTGSTVGSGTLVDNQQTTSVSENQWRKTAGMVMFNGLTPGAQYNVYLGYRSAVGTNTASISTSRILVLPNF